MELVWFIAGALCVLLFMPLINSILDLILTYIESKKIKYTQIIHNTNIAIQKTTSFNDETVHSIGFINNDDN